MILYLISELDVGGAEKSLYYLAKGLSPRFGKPVVASLWGAGRVGDWLEAAGIEVIRLHARRTGLHARRMGLLVAGWELRRMIRSGRFRLLHTFLYHANIVGRLAAIGTGVPVVSSIRVTEIDRPFRIAIDRKTIKYVAAETCVSEAVRQWSIQQGLPAEKLVTIPNAVDCAAYEAPPGATRRELGLPPDARIILFIGRLHRQKGPDVLLQAAAMLCERMPNVHVVLAGDGPLRAQLACRAGELGLGERFHLLGPRDDVPVLLADADLLALPSRWEGMPNAVLEAMAAGKPSVAADVGGCREVIVDGETGLLVPPNDPAALAAAVERILADRELAARMGAAARQRAQREFSVEKMVLLNEQLYDRFLK